MALDSSALVAILRMEPDARELLRALANARGRLISALNLLETSLVLAGPKGGAGIWGPLDAFLAEAAVDIVAFGSGEAQFARDAFIRYGKGRHPAALNFGDCAAYALAKSRNVPLLFKGGDFRKTDIVPAL
ncbi:MAG: type II toxin-antitoxin system VapC family toxin [Rhodomicrobium sp.]|nr:type II toxin-antitoxin system VapC family toxin [Rhodomicrobium sp.]